MQHRVMAVLVSGALLLSASGSALAAGKLGGSGGADECRRPRTEFVKDGNVGGKDRSTTQGGKLGGADGDG